MVWSSEEDFTLQGETLRIENSSWILTKSETGVEIFGYLKKVIIDI